MSTKAWMGDGCQVLDPLFDQGTPDNNPWKTVEIIMVLSSAQGCCNPVKHKRKLHPSPFDLSTTTCFSFSSIFQCLFRWLKGVGGTKQKTSPRGICRDTGFSENLSRYLFLTFTCWVWHTSSDSSGVYCHCFIHFHSSRHFTQTARVFQ